MKIKGITFYELPRFENPYLVAAFGGWGDAAQVATTAVSYLIRKKKARKFAEFRGEDFHSFTSVRPEVNIEQGVMSSLSYVHNSFYYYQGKKEGRDLILFRGVEPDWHWRQFMAAFFEIAAAFKVPRIYVLGGFYDHVPHTRAPRVSGVVSEDRLTALLRRHGVELINYQGPSGIHSLVIASSRYKSIEALSLWGHVPFYVKVDSNPIVCLGLLEKLTRLLALKLDMTEMKDRAETLTQTLDQILVGNEELRLYIQTLEEQYDFESVPSPDPSRGADRIIREVEDFLRKGRQDGSSRSSEFPF